VAYEDVSSLVEESDAKYLLREFDLTKQLLTSIPDLGCAVTAATDEETAEWQSVDL